MICIGRKYLGTEKHLLFHENTETFSWSEYVPSDAWTLGLTGSRMNIENIAMMFKQKLQPIAPPSHQLASQLAFGTINVPWHYILSPSVFEAQTSHVVQHASSLVQALSDSGYSTTYIHIHEFVNSLSRVHINIAKLNMYLSLEDNPTTRSTLESFLPLNKDGKAPPTVYNFMKTSTGRAVVESGPRVLTLPVKYRDIIAPSRPQTSLVQIDFISLEPRVALFVAQRLIEDEDIYGYLAEHIFDGRYSRSQVKIATLCVLYGVSSRRLRESLPGIDSEDVIHRIKKYFQVSSKTLELRQQLITDGFIQTSFGRPLFFGKDQDRVLYNHYVQSTAVDVALEGFVKLQKQMKDAGLDIQVLFMIHDAIILEVDKMSVDEVAKMCDEGIVVEKFGKFPLSFQVMKKNSH